MILVVSRPPTKANAFLLVSQTLLRILSRASGSEKPSEVARPHSEIVRPARLCCAVHEHCPSVPIPRTGG